MFPIYIPSKGRALTGTTTKLLDESNLEYRIVVEPHEVFVYRTRYGNKVLVLPMNNQGLAYSRNYCRIHSACCNSYHWQLDDDIRSFLRRAKGKKVEHISAREALEEVEREVLKYKNVGQAGLNQNSWPPNYDRPIAINNLPVQCVLNNNAVPCAYRKAEPLEDIDFTLQTLRAGYCTLMFDCLRTNCPPIGTNVGGLGTIYKDQEKILRSMQALVREFPTLSITEDEKGYHLKRNRIWSTFKQRPIPIKVEPFRLA